jgi:hypothetical protein
VLPPRRKSDFRGTIPYASLSAHLKFELGRKDDLWSFFFILLEFLNQELPWQGSKFLFSVSLFSNLLSAEIFKLTKCSPNLVSNQEKVKEAKL